MPISLEGTLAGRTIEARAEARVQTGMLTALLRRAHGQDPRIPALAARLAALPQDEAIDLALTADCLDKLTERLG